MALALAIAIMAAVFLLPCAEAQSDTYNVLASVVFLRTGERTPAILTNGPSILTSLGAQQAYSAGSFFRNRYVSSTSSRSGIDKAPLRGLSANSIEPRQMQILALDTQPYVATAQAFLQGLYPPYTLNESTAALLDPTSVLANGSYVENPLEGYQYAQIRTASELDPEFIFLAGDQMCPAFRAATRAYSDTPEFAQIQADSKELYESVGSTLLTRVLPERSWDYLYAYAIYDYLSYHAVHNATVADTLNHSHQAGANTTDLDRLRFLADAQQYRWLGNLTTTNNLTTPSEGLPGETDGSISTIAGNLLISQILSQLQLAIQTRGRTNKFSLLTGDFQPLLSFFALTGLSDLNSNKFTGIPDFASTAVFELFTYDDSPSFPSSPDDLWVRFYFRNGTEERENELDLQSYPLFSHGPSETDMKWRDFQNEAAALSMASVGRWCEACQSPSVFCPAFNSSLYSAAAAGREDSSDSGKPLTPGVTAVLGAVVALIVAALIFGLAMVFGGVRLHLKKRNDAGGFQGTAQMTPDRDVEVSGGGGGAGKAGAVVVGRETSVEEPVGGSVVGGHERVGSWEMKETMGGARTGDGRSRASFEDDGDDDDRRAVDPFADPVKPNERV